MRTILNPFHNFPLFPQPLIVLTMLTFFAQWRVYGCYRFDNFEILVMNGAAVLALLFFLWYIVWGLVQKTPFMGVSRQLNLVLQLCLLPMKPRWKQIKSEFDLYPLYEENYIMCI